MTKIKILHLSHLVHTSFLFVLFPVVFNNNKKRALTVWVYSALQLWKWVMRVTADFRLHKLCNLFSFTTVVRTSWWKLGRARPHTKLLVSIPSWVPLHCVVVRNDKVMLVFLLICLLFSATTLYRGMCKLHTDSGRYAIADDPMCLLILLAGKGSSAHGGLDLPLLSVLMLGAGCS